MSLDLEKLKSMVRERVRTEFLQPCWARPTLVDLEIEVKERLCKYVIIASYRSEEFGGDRFVTYYWKRWDDEKGIHVPREWVLEDYDRIASDVGSYIARSPSWRVEYVRTLEESSKERNEIITAKAMEILEPLGAVEKLQIAIGHGLIWEAQAILRVGDHWHFTAFEMCEYGSDVIQDPEFYDELAADIAEGITEDYYDVVRQGKVWINDDKRPEGV